MYPVCLKVSKNLSEERYCQSSVDKSVMIPTTDGITINVNINSSQYPIEAVHKALTEAFETIIGYYQK